MGVFVPAPASLLVTTQFPPGHGGVARMLAALAARFSDTDLAVLAPRAPREPPAAGAAVVEAPANGRGRPIPAWLKRHVSPLVGHAWSFVPPGLALARRRRFDIILCGHLQAGLAAWALAVLTRRPLVTFAYGDELLPQRARRRSSLGNRLQRHVLRVSRRVITISDFSRQLLLDLGVRPERIVKLALGAELPPSDAGAGAEAVRRSLGLAARPLVLSVGRLIPQKGHDVLLAAMPTVLAVVPDAACVIAGAGPEEASLRRQVERLGLTDAVRIAGFVPEDRLAGLYAACDVFALISRDLRAQRKVEGFGLVFLEANAHGKPVVAGRSGGVPDAVADGETGFLVDPLDPAAVATRLIELLKNPELARRLGRQGRQRVEHHYNWDAAARRLAQVLDEVAAGVPSGPA